MNVDFIPPSTLTNSTAIEGISNKGLFWRAKLQAGATMLFVGTADTLNRTNI